MGCTCSQDADDGDHHRHNGGVHAEDVGDLAGGRHRRRHRNLSSIDQQQAATAEMRHRRGFQNTPPSDDNDDEDDDASARRRRRQQAQEEADFALAQVLFQEQLQFIERQRRIEQQREAQPPASPTLPGLRADQFDAVGRVMRFDVAVSKPTGESAAVGGTAVCGDADGAAKAALTPITPKSHSNNGGGSNDGGDDEGNVFFATEPMECALCMEDLELGCELRLLFCGHAFHKTCVDDWLQRKRVCPMCQQDVTVVVAPPTRLAGNVASRTPTPARGWSDPLDTTSSDDDDAAGYVFENDDQAGEQQVDGDGSQTQESRRPRGVALPVIPPRASFESDGGSAVGGPQSPVVAGAGACGASVAVDPPAPSDAEPPRSATPEQVVRPRCRSGSGSGVQRSAAVAVSMSDIVLTAASTTGGLGFTATAEPSLPGHAASPQAPPAPAGAEQPQPQPEHASGGADDATNSPDDDDDEDSAGGSSSLNPFNQVPETVSSSPAAAPGTDAE